MSRLIHTLARWPGPLSVAGIMAARKLGELGGMSSEPSKLLLACEGRRLMAVTTKWYLAAGRIAGGQPVGLWLHFDDGATVNLQVASGGEGLKLSIDLPSRSIDMQDGGRIEVDQRAPEAIRRVLGKQLDAVRGLVNAEDVFIGVKLCLDGVQVLLYNSQGALKIDTGHSRDASPGSLREVSLERFGSADPQELGWVGMDT